MIKKLLIATSLILSLSCAASAETTSPLVCKQGEAPLATLMTEAAATPDVKTITINGDYVAPLKEIIKGISNGREPVDFDTNTFVIKKGATNVLVVLSKDGCIFSVGTLSNEVFNFIMTALKGL
jgi:hypothetical protein